MAWRFDANEVEPNSGFEPLPAGTYQLQIIEQQVKENSQGTAMLALTLDVVDSESGQYIGRKLFENLNLWHEKANVAEIASKQLSALCRSTGVMVLEDVETGVPELEFVPFTAKVTVTPRKGPDGRPTGEMQNRINPVLPEAEGQQRANPSTARSTQNGGAAPSTRPAAAARTAPPAGASRPGATTPPWKKQAATAA